MATRLLAWPTGLRYGHQVFGTLLFLYSYNLCPSVWLCLPSCFSIKLPAFYRLALRFAFINSRQLSFHLLVCLSVYLSFVVQACSFASVLSPRFYPRVFQLAPSCVSKRGWRQRGQEAPSFFGNRSQGYFGQIRQSGGSLQSRRSSGRK